MTMSTVIGGMFPTSRMWLDMRSLINIITRPPNRGQGRRVQPGQKIHASVIELMKKDSDYTPAAELNGDLKLTWEDIKTCKDVDINSKASSMIIQDLYSSASDIIAALKTMSTKPESQITRRDTDVLVQLASSCQ